MSNHSGSLANPTPLGLLGLAIVTTAAASQKLGITEGTSLLIPWAMFLGASAQLYASIVDSKLNNVFGATAFGGYAFFWYSVGCVWMVQNGVFGETMQANADIRQVGFAYIGYLIFSLYMTVAAAGASKLLFIILIFIDTLLIGLACSALGIMYHEMHLLAAYSEAIVAVLSFYGSAAAQLNTQFGKVILPVGKPLPIFQDK
ncbi:MAG: acetate uptake transporter [Bacillota bacterium]